MNCLRRQQVSIEDIAQAAGVSHSTVSRALRDSSLISIEVRERIQHLAREMGYTPNAIARSLQTQRTNAIGLVVTSIADPFWADVMKGVDEVARAAGFSLFLSVSYNDPELEMDIIETFHRRRVDGILVAASRITSNYKQRLDHVQVPTVLINSQAESQAELLHWVAVDDHRGAQLAVEYLLQLGHRSIGYLGAGNRPRSNRQRLEGYRSMLIASGVACRDEWIVIPGIEEASQEGDVAAGRASLPYLLDAGVSAVFCYNDMIAVGVLMACRERGIAVPEELSIIGFDDIALANYVTPPLTTICQPRTRLGQLAAQVLLELLDNRPGHNYVLPPMLITRSSTASLMLQ